MADSTLILKAASFAAEKHKKQRRKGGSGETPYINHPLGVAEQLGSIGGVTEAKVLAAAILHDTVEDTATTFEEIEKEFGKEIRDIVFEVTDDKSLAKDERKRLQVEHAPHASQGAKLVKLSDKLHNLNELLLYPIPTWGPDRIQGYFVWALRVIQGLRGTNAGLEAALDVTFTKEFEVNGKKYPAIPSTDPVEQEKFLQAYYDSMKVLGK